MKHAILILAHDNVQHLNDIVRWFDDDFDIYIHIDKKSNIDHSQLPCNTNLHIYKKYYIHWGGINIIKATLFLLRKASSLYSYNYYHLISGSDIPTKDINCFKSFFLNSTHSFVDYFPLPYKNWIGNGGMDRITKFWFFNNLTDIRKHHFLSDLSQKIQRKLSVNRSFNSFKTLYGGSQWWSVTDLAVKATLDYLDSHPDYFRRFRYTHIPDEIFFQTLFCNLNLPIQNSSLRYIAWEESSASPKSLTLDDVDKIMATTCFFARKYQEGISDLLKESLMSK